REQVALLRGCGLHERRAELLPGAGVELREPVEELLALSFLVVVREYDADEAMHAGSARARSIRVRDDVFGDRRHQLALVGVERAGAPIRRRGARPRAAANTGETRCGERAAENQRRPGDCLAARDVVALAHGSVRMRMLRIASSPS